MALILCPNCNQQVSDKAMICPHCKNDISKSRPCPECGKITTNDICEYCGYQLVTTITIESTASEVEKKKCFKRAIVFFSIAIMLILFAILFAITRDEKIFKENQEKANQENQENQENQYKSNLSHVVDLMVSGAAISEKSCFLIRAVWYNSIYRRSDAETDKYTKTNNSFNKDFNESLSILFQDPHFVDTIQSIHDNRTSVNVAMGKLLDPPEKYKDVYEETQSLYEFYLELTDYAIFVRGSLSSFTEESNHAILDFSHKYQSIQQYITG